MVEFLLLESGLGSLWNIKLCNSSSRLCRLLLRDSSLLLLNKLLFLCNLFSRGRLRVSSDDFVGKALQLDLFDTHLRAILKVKPEFSITDGSLLNKTLAGVVLQIINDLLLPSLPDNDLLLNLVVSLISSPQTKLHVVLDNKRLAESLSSHSEVVDSHG